MFTRWLRRDVDRDWERLARRDPYWAVITDPRYGRAHLDEAARTTFFESGEAHIAAVFDLIASGLDAGFRPARALDFGCGVGRTLAPLAARCDAVVGLDVAPSMLAEADRNCAAWGLDNVTLVPGDDRLSQLTGRFDLVHAFLVFQHIPARRGLALTRRLLARLDPGGIAVLHYVYYRRAGRLHKLGYRMRTALPPLHAALNVLSGKPWDDPLMQANTYDLNAVHAALHAADCRRGVIRFTDHQGLGYLGVLIVARRDSGREIDAGI